MTGSTPLQSVPHTLVHGDWKAANLGSHPDGRTIDQQFVVPVDAQRGDPSVQRFHLVARATGRLTLTFTLKRSWEREGVDTYIVEVEVE